MPELPDLAVYVQALSERIVGQSLERALIQSPFLLRTVEPSIQSAHGRRVTQLRRLGKRIAIGLEGELWLVFHLMIAGRLHWFERGRPPPKRATLARLQFSSGTLTVTEAGSKRRASLYVVQGGQQLRLQDPGGIEILQSSLAQFAERLRSENHTLKRALTDPRLFSGIGNAYSDEILHRAGLSPLALSWKIAANEAERLYDASRDVPHEWIERLRVETGDGFPEKVTAFRPGMAVHGRFGK